MGQPGTSGISDSMGCGKRGEGGVFAPDRMYPLGRASGGGSIGETKIVGWDVAGSGARGRLVIGAPTDRVKWEPGLCTTIRAGPWPGIAMKV